MQNGSAISKNMTPTLWLRLLRRNRAIAFGRYPSFFATSSMRFFCRRRNVTRQRRVVQYNRDCSGESRWTCATSRMVTVRLLPLTRFTSCGASADIIILLESPYMQWR